MTYITRKVLQRHAKGTCIKAKGQTIAIHAAGLGVPASPTPAAAPALHGRTCVRHPSREQHT